jgi:putative thioredoxin
MAMAIDVTEQTFEQEVVERSRELPVVVDFWAEWCGPCRVLGPVLEKAAEARQGQVVLAKVDTDSNPDLAMRFQTASIPAVKAFRDGEVVNEFIGAQPPARVEQFFDSLLPSPGVEAFARARELHRSGEDDEALQLLAGVSGSFEADGLAAHIELLREGPPELAETLALLDRGDTEAGLDALLGYLAELDGGPDDGELSDRIRRVVVGVLTEIGQDTDTARAYRRRLAAALG